MYSHQVEKAQLELEKADLSTQLVSAQDQLGVAAEEYAGQNAILSSELEKANKKVALLQEQLEEQQISTEK